MKNVPNIDIQSDELMGRIPRWVAVVSSFAFIFILIVGALVFFVFNFKSELIVK